MRDNFYYWLAVLILNAMFFGASVVRAQAGDVDSIAIVGSGVLGIAASACLSCNYRSAIKATQGGKDQDNG